MEVSVYLDAKSGNPQAVKIIQGMVLKNSSSRIL
jgi:hypothetical protein